jgi:hypothetical protein
MIGPVASARQAAMSGLQKIDPSDVSSDFFIREMQKLADIESSQTRIT